MSDLTKLRDELAAQHDFTERCANDNAAYYSADNSFRKGFDAALSALSERAGEFDEEAANAKGYEHSEESWQYFTEGARWQFEQDRARIGLAEGRLRVANAVADDCARRAEKAERERDKYKNMYEGLCK